MFLFRSSDRNMEFWLICEIDNYDISLISQVHVKQPLLTLALYHVI